MRPLVVGQRLPVGDVTPKDVLEIAVTLDEPPAGGRCVLALCVDAAQAVVGGDEVVSSAKPASRCGGVTWSDDPRGARVTLRLAQIAPAVDRVILALAFLGQGPRGPADASSLRNGRVTVSAGGAAVAGYDIVVGDGTHRALCLIEVYRKGAWRITVPGGGFVGGVVALLSNYRAHPDIGRTLESRNSNPFGMPFPPPSLPSSPSSSSSGGGRAAPRALKLPNNWPGGVNPVVPKDVLGAVGMIVIESRRDGVCTGTGFAVSPGGLVVTCAHVVEGADSGHFVGQSEGPRHFEVLDTAPLSDLALLRVTDGVGFERWMMLERPGAQPDLGDAVGILGYPLGIKLGESVSYCQGIVNSVRSSRDGQRVLQIDAGAAPGSSGAPVFSRESGRVLGVLTSGLRMDAGGMHINFAVDVSSLWAREWFRGASG